MNLVLGFLVLTLPQQNFVRINEGEFQTATATYEKDGKSLTLIGTVHVGESEYYRRQNSEFKNFDKVCYELVAPKNTKVRKDFLMGMIVNNLLGLSHQLNEVDYTAKNLVHADLDFKQMSEIVKSRGDNLLTLALKITAESVQAENLRGKRQPKFGSAKKVLAEQLVDSTIPNTLNQILVEDRNQYALDVAFKELENNKNVALYYGAAHLKDFHERLLKKGYKVKNMRWETAWKVD